VRKDRHDEPNSRINAELVTCYNSSQTGSQMLQTVAQQNSNLFEYRRTIAQSNHTKHSQTFCAAAYFAQNV